MKKRIYVVMFFHDHENTYLRSDVFFMIMKKRIYIVMFFHDHENT